MPDRAITELDEDQCMQLISPGGVGRIAYSSRYGTAILPVHYKVHDGAIVFRTAEHGPLDEDLRTGIEGADYTVAFEIDNVDEASREGWSVLLHGPAHHVVTDEDRAWAEKADVETWPPGAQELFVRIIPSRVTGRRVASG